MGKLITFILINIFSITLNSAQASTFIDTFDDFDPQVATPGSPSTVATTNAIGGYRKIEITKTGPLSATAFVGGGIYAHSADALTSAISTITWDANGAGLGIDLLTPDTLGFTGSSCFECFVIDVESIDQGNVDLTFKIIDAASHMSSFTATSVGLGINEFSFSNFGSLVNLSDIDSIALIVDGATASDLTLNFEGFTGSSVVSVPAPAAIWMILAGLVMISRRKKTL